jgi:hypothetical protein
MLRCWDALLKKYVKIDCEPTMPVAEKEAVGWIGSVPAVCFRIEVIRQVERTDLQTHRVFRTRLEIPPYARIDSKEVGNRLEFGMPTYCCKTSTTE